MGHIIWRGGGEMKRSLTPIFGLALLLAFTPGSAFAGNKADATEKADSGNTDAVVKRVIPPSPDKPDKLDGYELAMSCKGKAEGFDAGYCLGVVEGVIASMRVCRQDQPVITLGEAADAVEKYLSSHPDKLNERDVVLARKALSKAYPCGRQ